MPPPADWQHVQSGLHWPPCFSRFDETNNVRNATLFYRSMGKKKKNI